MQKEAANPVEIKGKSGLMEHDSASMQEETDAAPETEYSEEFLRWNQPAIGIDLGTSTSAIALFANEQVELLTDEQGDQLIPSVVQVALGNEILVGSNAKATAVAYHDRTILEVKRLMGTSETIKAGPRTFNPEQVSTLILQYLKKNAERHLGREIQDVVLSVPARFENDAREATRRAAQEAGFNVLRLINEPTAAAIAYGLNHLEENQRIMVFDFGGGTLDVTVLEMFDGVLDVKTSVGDDRLGGKDVDDVIVNIFRDAYKEQHNTKLPAPSRNRKVAQILKEEAENYKKMLSFSDSVQVEIPTLTEDGGISMVLTREMLENQLEELLLRAMALCNEALSRARFRWEDIDVVLPVGGSSRIPMFRRALGSLWGREIQDYDNPDEAVAKGAAIAAELELQRLRDEAMATVQEERRKALLVLDVSPHRLGVATIKQVGAAQFVEDYFSEIIPKDEKLPAHRKRDYFTSFHGDEPIAIKIYEAASDSNLCRDHHLVSELPLRNLSPDSDGEPVQVDFRYTMDGTLDVSVSYLAVPTIKVEGQFVVLGGNRGTTNGTGDETEADEEVIAEAGEAEGEGAGKAPAAPVRRTLDQWRTAPNADVCAPLLEQAERMEQEYPDASPILRDAANKVKVALIAEEETEMRRHLDALTDVLFDLA
ncbi:MAG: hypothetical protein OHK0029_40430 [Armatimonadaceae bacterium]